MRKLFGGGGGGCIAALVGLLGSGYVMAQDACIQDEKPHYFVATGTTKTTMTDPLKAVLTPQKQCWKKPHNHQVQEYKSLLFHAVSCSYLRHVQYTNPANHS